MLSRREIISSMPYQTMCHALRCRIQQALDDAEERVTRALTEGIKRGAAYGFDAAEFWRMECQRILKEQEKK